MFMDINFPGIVSFIRYVKALNKLFFFSPLHFSYFINVPVL